MINTNNNIMNYQLSKYIGDNSIAESIKKGILKKGDNIILPYSNLHVFDLAEVCTDLIVNDINTYIVLEDKYQILLKKLIILGDKKIKQKLDIINIITPAQYLKGEYDYMKGKMTIGDGNPPYDGNSQLHQKIFNKTLELLEDGGQMTFIQPATPVHNKKEDSINKNSTKSPMLTMRENLCNYYTEVEIVSGSVFKDAAIATDLMITTIIKKQSDFNGLNKITYKNGQTYTNVNIEDISMTQISPKIYSSILKKYKKLCLKNGTLNDIAYFSKKMDIDSKYVSIAQIRGNINKETGELVSDFFTYFSDNDIKRNDTDIKYGLLSNNKENVYNYLSSNVARFGLSLLKFNNNNHRGENKMTPLVDFSKIYTEQELYDMLGLTEEEIIEIEKVIPYWDHFRNTKEETINYIEED